MDPREFDRRVLESIDHILAKVTAGQLGRPTPCTEWTLGDLLRHMVGHHRGFAAAARGSQPDPDVWDGATLDADPYATYRVAADEVTRAFAEVDLDRDRLAVYGYGTFPATVALNMHAVDFLGHGWDVARAIGVDDALDEELCTVALGIAARWPDTPATWGPSGPFRERVPVADEAPAYQRLMGFLGRPPDWPHGVSGSRAGA
jgi:uncharacterized protein (TIGR03086 family)